MIIIAIITIINIIILNVVLKNMLHIYYLEILKYVYMYT